jgi:hypothetical protein
MAPLLSEFTELSKQLTPVVSLVTILTTFGVWKAVAQIRRFVVGRIAARQERQMQAIADELRRRVGSNRANVLSPEIGSKHDRLYSKMATKGYLLRTHSGYRLPHQHRGGFYGRAGLYV